MRTILFTGFDDAYKPLAELTVPLMLSYASRHGFDFKCYRSPIIDVPNGIYWTGICGALDAFRDYDRVIYLDADQMITNPEIVPQVAETGVAISKDWGADAVEPWHFSMCGWIAFKNAAVLFCKVIEKEPHWRDRPFPEQAPMQDMYWNVPWVPPMVQVHDRRMFNAVPKEVSTSVQEPWQPGDFCAHLTMLGLPDRILLFHKIKAQNEMVVEA
jgi:hypothetical protein